ncbi:6592_t:CDS:2 [Ambispora leptoticha]|uniref:6592_t:CDS:1 n=1 Tax=Ambispora leptoticha TaxID=144679 RepID=A0A9N9BU00_9GLOM|nr:6592_t:CDS:2 [Ambispora leptoticha]
MEEQNDRDVDRRLSQMKRQTKEYEFNPKGSAEQGQASFKKIVATISNYDLFPENEIAPDNSPEAQAAIKELEGLLEKK